MADLLKDSTFQNAVERARDGITDYASDGVPDAIALSEREAGGWHMQSHPHTIVPLAVHFGRYHRDTMTEIRRATKLENNMDDGRSGTEDERRRNRAETRHEVWERVKREMDTFVKGPHAADVISETLGGEPRTVAQVAENFLSEEYGGGYESGHGGNSVIKRTLKLTAHREIA